MSSQPDPKPAGKKPATPARMLPLPEDLAEVLGPAQIVPELTAKNRWEAIDELMSVLAATGKIRRDDVEAIAVEVKRREYCMTTGVGHGIGTPTATTGLLDTMVVAFGRSLEGVDFDAMDGKPVEVVVLLLQPLRDYRAYLSRAAALGRLLDHIAFREAVRKAQDANGIYRCMQAAWRDVRVGLKPEDSLRLSSLG